MKLEIIKEYNDSQLKRRVVCGEVIDVKTKTRAKQLIAAGVAVEYVTEGSGNNSGNLKKAAEEAAESVEAVKKAAEEAVEAAEAIERAVEEAEYGKA